MLDQHNRKNAMGDALKSFNIRSNVTERERALLIKPACEADLGTEILIRIPV